LLVAPVGKICYTLDGSEPREGIPYEKPIEIGNGDVILRAFAEASGLETKEDFKFQAKGKKGLQIDDVKRARIASRSRQRLDSRGKTYDSLKLATEKGIKFEGVTLSVGQGNQVIGVTVGDIEVDAQFVETILRTILSKFEPTTPITMTFRKASFASGHDLREFAEKLGLELQPNEIEQ